MPGRNYLDDRERQIQIKWLKEWSRDWLTLLELILLCESGWLTGESWERGQPCQTLLSIAKVIIGNGLDSSYSY